jgi:hypothetical protein
MEKYMKYFLVILTLFALNISYNLLNSQEEDIKPEDLDPLRFYKAKYEATYKAPIDVVTEAVRKAIEDINCVLIQDVLKTDQDGWLRAIIKSDYCVFAEGDSTFALLKKYSYEMPFIRGGAWSNGRMQYKFVITEKPDNKVYLLLKGNISGFEHYVTNRVHFWVSNGTLEHEILEAIENNIKEITEE